MKPQNLFPLAVLLLAGCSEYPQQVAYQDGAYQGKYDQRSWDGTATSHDRLLWEQMINARTQYQNEYARIGE